MTETPLKEYMRPPRTQAWLANKLGVTQPTVHRWLRLDVDVMVVEHADGRITAYEKRPLGKAS